MPNQPGLDDRHRDADGAISKERGDTLVKTLRNTYGDSFAAGMPSDMTLPALLARTGQPSLSQYLQSEAAQAQPAR